MSRSYSMHVTIIGANPDRFDAVKDAASDEWDFEDWDEHGGTLEASANDQLCAGTTEEEFAEQLAKAIWTANGGPCEVEVIATYLEDLPWETYTFDESDYDRLITANKEATDDG